MSATIPAASTVTFVTAGPVRAHVISVIAHGVSVEKLAALTGVDRALIRSLTAHGRNRTTIVSDVADRLFLVRPDLSDAAPTDRVIAAGATS